MLVSACTVASGSLGKYSKVVGESSKGRPVYRLASDEHEERNNALTPFLFYHTNSFNGNGWAVAKGTASITALAPHLVMQAPDTALQPAAITAQWRIYEPRMKNLDVAQVLRAGKPNQFCAELVL